MKKLFTTFIMAAAAVVASASTPMQLQGVTFDVDTVSHFYIGPGVTQTQIQYKNADRVFQAYVVMLNRAEAAGAVSVKVDVGRDSCNTAEAITSIAKRKTTADRQYLAGINGDFFITSSFAAQHEFKNAILGYPNMSCATESKLVAPDIIDVTSRENALIVANDGNMYIDETAFKYRVLNNAGDTILDAASFNYPRRAQEMVVYNSYMGGYTKTDATGRELVLRLAPGAKWAMNKSVKFIVDGEWRQGGNSKIPADGIVISVGPNYKPAKIAFLDNLHDGSVVKLKLVCNLPAFENAKPDIAEICGGDVRILNENNTVTSAIRFINTPSAKYSRSLVGYSKDRNLLVMCAVDAGAANSSGVTYYEAGDLMRNLGCWDALDLDGGGSTAIWSHSHGIFNHLRDGSERAVGNGLFLCLNDAKDNQIASIRFADHVARLPKYGLYTPVIMGYNKQGQLISTDVKGFVLTAPADLGEVHTSGVSLLASGAGTHALTATYNGMTATLPVTVDDSAPATPAIEDVLLDQHTPWTIQLQATVGNVVMPVTPTAYTWTSSNPSVATVDADGVVTGLRNGSTTISGVAGDLSVSLNVTVECADLQRKPLESTAFDNADWKYTSTGVTTSSIKGTPWGDENGCEINFNVSSTRGPYIAMSKDIRIWSRPDAISLSFNPLNSTYTAIVLDIQPANASRAISYTYSGEFAANTDTEVTIPLSQFKDTSGEAVNPDDFATYPVTFKKLRFTYSGKTGAASVRLNHLSALYSKASGVESITADQGAATAALHVRVDGDMLSVPFAAANLAVFAADGRCVASAANASAIAAPAAPGLYIVRADGATAKVLLNR